MVENNTFTEILNDKKIETSAIAIVNTENDEETHANTKSNETNGNTQPASTHQVPRQQAHVRQSNAESSHSSTTNNGIANNTFLWSPLQNELNQASNDKNHQQRAQTESIISIDNDGDINDDGQTDEVTENDWYSAAREVDDMHANFRNNNLNRERQITPIVVKFKKDEQAGLHRILLTRFRNNDFMWETASKEIIRLRPYSNVVKAKMCEFLENRHIGFHSYLSTLEKPNVFIIRGLPASITYAQIEAAFSDAQIEFRKVERPVSCRSTLHPVLQSLF